MISIFLKGTSSAIYRGDVGLSGSENIGLCYGPRLQADALFDADKFENPVFSKEYARDKWPKRYLTHVKHEGSLSLWQGEWGFEGFEALPYYNGYVAYRRQVGDGEYEYLLDPRGNGLFVREQWRYGDVMAYRQFIDPDNNLTVLAVAYAPRFANSGYVAGTWCYLAAHAFRLTFNSETSSYQGAYGVMTASHPIWQRPEEAVFNEFDPSDFSWSTTEQDGWEYYMWEEYSSYDSTDANIDMETLISAIRVAVNFGLPNISSAYDTSVFIDAIRNFRPGTTNLGEFTVGLKELPPQVAAIVAKTARVNLTVLADIFLSWCYGLRPLPDDLETVKQLGSIIAKFKRQFSDESIAGRKNIEFQEFTGHECLLIKLKEPVNTPIEDRVIPDQGVLRAGRSIGLATPITGGAIRNAIADGSLPVDVWGLARNVWELLPFSFVFDWFNNVSHKLRFSEDLAYARRCAIKYVEMSIKMYRISLPENIAQIISSSIPEGFDWTFNVSTTVYQRDYRRNIPDNVSYEPCKTGNFTHWWEAGALLTSVFLGRRK